MAVPTYGGLAIFGTTPKMQTVDRPSREMVQKLFGADGLVLLPGGFNGRFTFVWGVVFAPSGTALGFLRSEVEALKDGGCRVLVDCLGREYLDVQLEAWDLYGRVAQAPDGRAFSRLRARLLHLS